MGYSAAPSSLLVSHSQFTDFRPRATLAVGPTAAGYNALPPPPPFVTRTSGSPVVFSRTTHTPRTRPPINCAPRSPSPRPPPSFFFPYKPPLRLPLTSIAAARPDCVVRGVTPLSSISSPVVRALGPHPYRRVARPSPHLRVTSFRRGSRWRPTPSFLLAPSTRAGCTATCTPFSSLARCSIAARSLCASLPRALGLAAAFGGAAGLFDRVYALYRTLRCPTQ